MLTVQLAPNPTYLHASRHSLLHTALGGTLIEPIRVANLNLFFLT